MSALKTNQMIRFLKVFAEAKEINLHGYSIISNLISEVERNIQEIEDTDVIHLVRAYQFIDPSQPKSGKLFNKLNDTVH